MITWIMIVKGKLKMSFIKAEPPCWKGEMIISIFNYSIIVGWQR